MPPPIGVVSGPLMPIRCSRNASTVSSGSQLPVWSNACCPASTSFHAIFLPCFAAAASNTSCDAGQMSTPVPSPSMNGMIGSSGTRNVPPDNVIFSGMSGVLLHFGRALRSRSLGRRIPAAALRDARLLLHLGRARSAAGYLRPPFGTLGCSYTSVALARPQDTCGRPSGRSAAPTLRSRSLGRRVPAAALRDARLLLTDRGDDRDRDQVDGQERGDRPQQHRARERGAVPGDAGERVAAVGAARVTGGDRSAAQRACARLGRW